MEHAPVLQHHRRVKKLAPVARNLQSDAEVHHDAVVTTVVPRTRQGNNLVRTDTIPRFLDLLDVAEVSEGTHLIDVLAVKNNEPAWLQLRRPLAESTRHDSRRRGTHRQGRGQHVNDLPAHEERQINAEVQSMAATRQVMPVGFVAEPVMKPALALELQRPKSESVGDQKPCSRAKIGSFDDRCWGEEEVAHGAGGICYYAVQRSQALDYDLQAPLEVAAGLLQ